MTQELAESVSWKNDPIQPIIAFTEEETQPKPPRDVTTS